MLIDNDQEDNQVHIGDWLNDKLEEKENTDEIFLFFGGEGIKHLFDNDELTKIRFDQLKNRFDLLINPLRESMGFKKIHVDEQIMHYSHQFFCFN